MAAFSEYKDSKGVKHLSGRFTMRNLSSTPLDVSKGWVINHLDNPLSQEDCFYGFPFDIESAGQDYSSAYNVTKNTHKVPYYQSLFSKPDDIDYTTSDAFTLREYSVYGDEFIFTINFKPERIGQHLSILTFTYEAAGVTSDFTVTVSGSLLCGVLAVNHVALGVDTGSVDGVNPFSIFEMS